MKSYLSFGISFIIGVIFLFSAYVKLDPIELFEYTFIEIKIANWTTAPYIARLFIGLEFFIGLLLVFNFNGGKKWVPKFTLIFLLLLTLYLVLLWIIEGNTGNCGCFGTFIKLTPLESILKNIVLISLTGLLFLFQSGFNPAKYVYIVLVAAVSSFFYPFTNPIGKGHPPSASEINYKLDLTSLYDVSNQNPPKDDLMQGKRIIAFLSLTCEHCKLGAHKLHLMHVSNPSIPIYFILNGEDENKKDFFEESKAGDIPHSMMTAKQGFVKNAGLRLPAILWVNDGLVLHRVDYSQLEQKEIETWLQKKQ